MFDPKHECAEDACRAKRLGGGTFTEYWGNKITCMIEPSFLGLAAHNMAHIMPIVASFLRDITQGNSVLIPIREESDRFVFRVASSFRFLPQHLDPEMAKDISPETSALNRLAQ
jgi:hypothetical protein